MSLRDTLKATVARCTPYAMQLATFTENYATGDATSVQQLPAIPHGIRVNAATAIATAMQRGQKSSATPANSGEKLHVACTSECNTQLGALTAHRLAKELIEAAMKVCDQHGDGQAARTEMRRDCLALPPHLQADLLEHFQGKSANPPNQLVKAGGKQDD